MFYKLSNIANRKIIEKEMDVSFDYPNLYEPVVVINGLKETTLSIITMEDPKKVKYAIWGLLPETFEDNWDVFQDVTNTLNINLDEVSGGNNLYSEALQKGRCLIVVTGFFTSSLHDGTVYPYHVYLPENKPFCIAGVYNELNDGFLTCSILVTKVSESFKDIPNLSGYKPLIFNKSDWHQWLNPDCGFEDISSLITSHKSLHFKSHPICKEFYDDDILFKKIIDTHEFKNLSSPY